MKNIEYGWVQWLKPVILATQDAEIRKIRQKLLETPSPPIKAGCDGVYLPCQLSRRHK
jgi:hypothetical protein